MANRSVASFLKGLTVATLIQDPDFGSTWQGTFQEFISSIDSFDGWKKTQKRNPDTGMVMLDVRPGGGFVWDPDNERGEETIPQTKDVICKIKGERSTTMSREELDRDFVVEGYETIQPSNALFQQIDDNYPYISVQRKKEPPVFGFIPSDPENFEIDFEDGGIFLNTDCIVCVNDPENIKSIKDLKVIVFPEDTYDVTPWGRQNFDATPVETPDRLTTNVSADLLTEYYIDQEDLKTLAQLRTKKLDKLNKAMHTQSPELAKYIDKELQFAFDGLECTRTFLTKSPTHPHISAKTSGVLDGLRKGLDAYREFKEARTYIKALKESWETHLPSNGFKKGDPTYTMCFQEAEEDINFGAKAEHARQAVLAELGTGIDGIEDSKTAASIVPKL